MCGRLLATRVEPATCYLRRSGKSGTVPGSRGSASTAPPYRHARRRSTCSSRVSCPRSRLLAEEGGAEQADELEEVALLGANPSYDEFTIWLDQTDRQRESLERTFDDDMEAH